MSGCGKLHLVWSYSIRICHITYSVVFVKTEDTSKAKPAGKGSSGYAAHLSYCMLLYSGYNGLSEYTTALKNF